jgi:hypothetical protein
LERADEVVGEGLDGRVADGQPAAVLGDVVGDRVQEVGLAEPGRPADEERVVGEPGHLGHGQRGTVGEPVGVADHELVERVPRVQLGAGEDTRGRRRRRRRPRAGSDDLDAGARPEHGLGAGREQPSEAGLDPGATLRRRLDDQRVVLHVPRDERLEPELPRGVADRPAQLLTDAPPGMLYVDVGHVRAEGPPPTGEVVVRAMEEGPRSAPEPRT